MSTGYSNARSPDSAKKYSLKWMLLDEEGSKNTNFQPSRLGCPKQPEPEPDGGVCADIKGDGLFALARRTRTQDEMVRLHVYLASTYSEEDYV